MSLTLTTFAAGAVVDATTMRSTVNTIETYLNEGVVAADRASGWLEANRLYRPDFYGAPNPHTTFPSGEVYFRSPPADEARRVLFSKYIASGAYVPVPGLCATFQIPETLLDTIRLRVFASFYVYEYGGNEHAANANLDEATHQAAAFRFALNGTTYPLSHRMLYKGTETGANNYAGAFYPRKQISMCYAFPTGNVTGVNHVGVYIGGTADTYTRHIVFQQGNLIVRYYLR